MSNSALDIVIVLAAIGLGWGLIRLAQSLWTVDPTAPVVGVAGRYSPVLTWLRDHRLPRLVARPRAWPLAWAQLWPAAELGAIGLWAAWFGVGYFNLDPSLVPWGNEFGVSIQSNYIWTLLNRCGACVFWNGFTNGGAPAFVDLHGAPLHPLVILATLIWGPVNGAKLTVVACLALVGAAQWWLARALGLGGPARLWSAALAVVSGNVAGRMEMGLVSLALSTAMAALVIAASLHLALTGRRRAALGLGVVLGLCLLSGQGYLQIGLALSVLPALAILLFEKRLHLAPVWKEFALAAGLAVLLSAVLWVPVAHFWPNLAKETDPAFLSAQPLGATALNLFINDANFFYDTTLGKFPWPYLYINYIGWIPAVLALAALPHLARRRRRLLAFFLVAILLVFLAASAATLRALALVLPQFAAAVRNPAPIAGLAVPLILALAACGLDRLLKLNWPRLRARWPSRAAPAAAGLSTAWLVLALPLAWSLQSAYDFSQGWLLLYRQAESQTQVLTRLQQLAPAGQVQWVQTPVNENLWLTPALDAGLKLAYYFRAWSWSGRANPAPYAAAVRQAVLTSDPAYRGTLSGLTLLAHPEQQYAAVTLPPPSSGPGAVVPCTATALGGDIDVVCVTDQPGQLVVEEHYWTGWSVWLDGRAAALTPAEWLTLPAPAGRHSYTFRYRPWDVPLGLALTSVGVVLAVLLWRRSK